MEQAILIPMILVFFALAILFLIITQLGKWYIDSKYCKNTDINTEYDYDLFTQESQNPQNPKEK